MIQHEVDTEASTYRSTLASFIFRNDEKFPQKIITRTFFCEEKY
jgi:hypothetical protein